MLASNLVGAQALQLKLQPCDQKQSPKENNRASDRLLLTYLKQSLGVAALDSTSSLGSRV